MSKIVLLAFTLCTIPVALGSLSLSKSHAQAICSDDTVTIETTDKIPFEVEVRYAQLSQTLSNLIKEVGIENSLPLECSSYTWSLIQCLLPKVLNVTLGIEAQEAQEEIIEMIESWDPQTLLNFLYAVIYLDIPVLQKVSLDEMAHEKKILAIPAESLALIPGNIRNPIIMRHLINALGPLPIKPLTVCNGVECFTVKLGGKIISGGGWLNSYDIVLWDSSTCQQLAVCKGHTDYPRIIDIMPDGNIISGSLDGTIRIWDSKTGEQLAVLDNMSPITALCVTPDGKVVSGSDDGTICIWNGISGQQLARWQGHSTCIGGLVVLGKTLFSVSLSSVLISVARVVDGWRIWDLPTGEQLLDLPSAGYVTLLTITPEGQVFLTDREHRIIMMDFTMRQKVVCEGHRHSVRSLCTTPDGKIAAASLDRTIHIWDGRTGKQLAVCYGHEAFIVALAVASDSKIVSASLDKTIRIWDANTGEQLVVCEGHTDEICELVATPDGKIVSTSKDNTIRIWDSTTGQLLAYDHGYIDCITSLRLAPNGKIVYASNGKIYLLDSLLTLPMNTHQVKKVWLYLQQLIQLRNSSAHISLINIFNKAFWRRVGDKLTSTAARWQEIERILSEDKKDV